jgi:peptidoglycan hydrolase-like protein with peptidoglycan-binding domain
VLEIQDRLLELGYLEYGGVDGTYSEKPRKEIIGKTAAAVQQFQKDHGITPTGRIDYLTLTALYQIVPETPLGMLSGAFESPTEGLAAIGWDARGGTSYGRFQLSSKNEVVTKFVKSLEAKKDDPQAQQIAQALKDSQFPTNREDKNGPKGTVLNTYDKGSYAKTGKGTPMEVWRQYARQLKPYVEGFVIDKYYTTPINKAKMNFSRNKDLWNMIENSRTLQEVFMSTAIQHGQYEVGNFWNRIYNSLGNKEKNPDTLIKEIYAVRKADYSQHAKRYEKEEKLASDMREYEAD